MVFFNALGRTESLKERYYRTMTEKYYRNFTEDEFEVEYNARQQVSDSAKYVEFNEDRSREYRADSRCELDIEFGSGPLQKLDVFLPEQPAAGVGAPVHLFIHGGYWRSRTKESFSFMAKPLNERGAVVIVPSYSLCPEVKIGDIVDEMRTVVRWVFANAARLGGDPRNLHVSGHSAGGHLAAMLAATDWAAIDKQLPADMIKSSVPISGLFELSPMLMHSINQEIFLDEAQVANLSPIRFKPNAPLPMHVYVGGDESGSFQEQSSEFAKAWENTEASIQFDALPGLNHYTILSNLYDSEFAITKTLTKMMSL